MMSSIQDAFVRFLCGESAVALLLDESKPRGARFDHLAERARTDALLREMGRRRTVRVSTWSPSSR